MNSLEVALKSEDIIARYDFEIVEDYTNKPIRVGASVRLGRICGLPRTCNEQRYIPCKDFYTNTEARYSLEKLTIPAQPVIVDPINTNIDRKTEEMDNSGLLIRDNTKIVEEDFSSDILVDDTTSLIIAGVQNLELIFRSFADMQFGFNTDDPRVAALAKIYVDLYTESIRHI